MRYLLVFFAVPFYGQILHHQMLSSLGTSTELKNGLLINQTIGQQSAIGTLYGNTAVIQGFQQSLWSSYITSNDQVEINTLTYPNPFTETINFHFSQSVPDQISVYVYDLVGRLVFEKDDIINDRILTINLSRLPHSEYLVRLQTLKFNYYTKIIKL